MEALGFTDVVDHVVMQELVDVVGGNFPQLHPIDSLESCPGLEPMLLGQLLPLLFDDFFVFRDRLQQLKHFETSCLCQHVLFLKLWEKG